MKALPKWMYIDGTIYYYNEWQGENDLKEWYFCGLFSHKNDTWAPPCVKTIHGYSEYLVAAAFSMEEAHKDLLERINSMVYET